MRDGAFLRVIRICRRRVDISIRPERHPRGLHQHSACNGEAHSHREHRNKLLHRSPRVVGTRHTIACGRGLSSLRGSVSAVRRGGAAGTEVAWLRLLTMTMGHTTGAVGAVLAAFMGGLAVGAWFAGRFTDSLNPRRALRIYAALEAAVAVCALAMPFATSALQPLLAWAYADGSGGALFGITRLVASIVVVALPGAAMGASFPVGVCVVFAEGEKGAKGARGARGATGASRCEQVREGAKRATPVIATNSTPHGFVGSGCAALCGKHDRRGRRRRADWLPPAPRIRALRHDSRRSSPQHRRRMRRSHPEPNARTEEPQRTQRTH